MMLLPCARSQAVSQMRRYCLSNKGIEDFTVVWVSSSSHIVGIGLRGACPHGLKCWLYFPEDDCPFYRTTVFSHYAPNNCPAPDTALRTLCLVRALSVARDTHAARRLALHKARTMP